VHEGFCLSLIEALAHGVPVVAREAGAMPETLGGAGIVVDGPDLPLVAEALHGLASSPSTRRLLFDAADARLRELRPGDARGAAATGAHPAALKTCSS
jgi:glycosyltransferase involved in cell wall biosynthesis